MVSDYDCCQNGYYSDDSGMLINPHAYQRSSAMTVFLLLACFFLGPIFILSRSLPPIRVADFFILFFMFTRWSHSARQGRSFLFGRDIRLFSVPIIIIAFTVLFATGISVMVGRFPFLINMLFVPIMLIRMALIAAIFASLNYNHESCRKYLKIITIMAVVSVSIAILQKYRPGSLANLLTKFYALSWDRAEMGYKAGVGARIVGVFGNPNIFGCVLVLLAACMFSFGMFVKGILRYVFFAAFFVTILTVMVSTGSRTSLLAIAVIVVSGLAISFRKETAIPLILMLVSLVIGYVFIVKYFYSLGVNERLYSMTTGQEFGASSFYARFHYWKIGLDEAMVSILWGIGEKKQIGYFIDNGYIAMFNKTGLIGIVAYFTLLLGILLRSYRAIGRSFSNYQKALLMAGILVVLNHMVFEITTEVFWSIRYGGIFAVFVGVLCGIWRQLSDDAYYQDQEYCDEIDQQEMLS